MDAAGDAEIQGEARKAVGELDLAAWERVRLLMLRRGAQETEQSKAERTRIAQEFLADFETLNEAILTEAGAPMVVHGGAATEAELLRRILDSAAATFESYPSRGGQQVEYVRSGQVAIALNRMFGITGWGLRIDSLRFVDRPHTMFESMAASTNERWLATAVAVVTLRVQGPGGRTAERQEVGVGTQVGRSATTSAKAAEQALTSAVKNAFKNAARFIAPATGLTLQWDEELKEEVRAKLEDDLRRCMTRRGSAAP